MKQQLLEHEARPHALSAVPGLVIAEARIERRGKSSACLEGLIRNERGELLAKGTSTVRLVPMRRPG